MTNSSSLFFSFFTAIVITGCASDIGTPFNSLTVQDEKSGRIRVRAINDQNCVANTVVSTCLMGEAFVNGTAVGKFSKKFQEFSTNVPVGELSISICPPHKQLCLTHKTQIKAGERKDFEYVRPSIFPEPILQLNELESDSKRDLESTKTTIEAQKIDTEAKCLQLGFKKGTASFKECENKIGN
jgi:hypothetical protein